MDAYFQGDMIVWSTQFNPGGIFYRKLHDRERRQSNTGLIVSDQNQSLHDTNCFQNTFLFWLSRMCWLSKLKLLSDNDFIQMGCMPTDAFPFKTDRFGRVSKRSKL